MWAIASPNYHKDDKDASDFIQYSSSLPSAYILMIPTYFASAHVHFFDGLLPIKSMIGFFLLQHILLYAGKNAHTDFVCIF